MKNFDKGIEESILLFPGEVQKLLGIGSTQFYEFVKTEDFPKPRKVGTVKTPMFLRSELMKWAEELPADNRYIKDEE